VAAINRALRFPWKDGEPLYYKKDESLIVGLLASMVSDLLSSIGDVN